MEDLLKKEGNGVLGGVLGLKEGLVMALALSPHTINIYCAWWC